MNFKLLNDALLERLALKRIIVLCMSKLPLSEFLKIEFIPTSLYIYSHWLLFSMFSCCQAKEVHQREQLNIQRTIQVLVEFNPTSTKEGALSHTWGFLEDCGFVCAGFLFCIFNSQFPDYGWKLMSHRQSQMLNGTNWQDKMGVK